MGLKVAGGSSEQIAALEWVIARHPEIAMGPALGMVSRHRRSAPFAVVKISGEYLVEEFTGTP